MQVIKCKGKNLRTESENPAQVNQSYVTGKHLSDATKRPIMAVTFLNCAVR